MSAEVQMQVADHQQIAGFLQAALARLEDASAVEMVETHISKIFIGRSLAWKLKKPVRRPYLDFSTSDLRLACCQRELELNRRTAPQLYRRVIRVTQDADGMLALEGAGRVVDAVLEMRRFDQDRLLDRMAQRDELTVPLVSRLAGVIADFHHRAEPHRDDRGTGSARVAAVLDINERGLADARVLFGDAYVLSLTDAMRSLWESCRPLLDARQHEGHVRLTHGDLHLRNLVEIDGAPVLFDCLEFNVDMATTDVLYDLAFILMDLWHRDLRALANLLFNRYLDLADQLGGLSLMSLFLAMRATVRGHVLATQAVESRVAQRDRLVRESRAYLDLALGFLHPRPARLVAIGGFSGTGKSTVAAAVADGIGLAPGARILSSDRIRKRLYGVAPETRLSDDAYRPEISAKVYAGLRDEARAVLATGHSAIVDAVQDQSGDRDAIADIARKAGARFTGLWLEAPQDVLIARVKRRRGDPSDATADVVRQQLMRDPGRIDWHRIHASNDGSAAGIRAILGRDGGAV